MVLGDLDQPEEQPPKGSATMGKRAWMDQLGWILKGGMASEMNLLRFLK